MARRNFFTIFHALEAKGLFASNPANADSRNEQTGEALYQGPVPYPRMLYHPEGAERIIVPAEIITTPMGPKAVGEQRELIWQIANDAKEEKILLAKGWHNTPAKAVAARTGVPIVATAEERIDKLEVEKRELEAQLSAIRAEQLAATRPTGTEVNRARDFAPSVTKAPSQA